MSIDKLYIQPKVDNAAKKKMVAGNEIGVSETLLANEVNAIVNKVNEVVDAYNFGAPITAFNFKENVPTYADLPLVGNEVNDGYGVIADGLVYVWNGTAFPSQGQGMDLNLRPTGKVQDGDPMAVAGGEVYSKFNPFIDFANFLPFDLKPGEVSVIGEIGGSTNWIRTDFIGCQPNTLYSAIGLGLGTGSLELKRVFFWNENTFLGYIPNSPITNHISFNTPANCNRFIIQINAASGAGADIPNSPFWDSLKIYEGTEVQLERIKAEKIKGSIETEQIKGLEKSSAVFQSLLLESFRENSITTTQGALTTSGGATEAINYIRTSVSNINSMAHVSAGKKYTYTGEIKQSGYTGVVFKSESLTTLGVACAGIKTYNREELELPQGTKYIATCSYLNPPIIEEKIISLKTEVEADNVVYVNSNYVGDESNGTVSKPYRTISDALLNISSSAKIFISGGDYREVFPFHLLETGNYSFIGKRGERIRFLGSNKITDFNLASGQTNTYVADFSGTIPSGNRFGKLIFEDGNPSRPIFSTERHPLQKSLSDRLPFTPLTEKTSITDVENNAGTFYHDSANSKLYIHASNSIDPNMNGFSYEVMARNWTTVISPKTSKLIDIHIENIQFMYGINSLIFQGFNSVFRRDITAIATTAAGAFRDDTSNIIAYNDEAAFCNGDGINGHFAAWVNYQDLTDHRSMQPTVIYFDPWCHDNWDDGMSHHENHRVTLHGGLIEYNDDGGVRASNDSGYTIYNTYARKNGLITGAGEGFSVVNPTINEKRNGCKMILYSCLSEGNAYGYASISDSRNFLEAINCISRNNVNGELYANYGTIISRNTRATNTNSVKLKVNGNGGIITVLNDEILE